MPTHKKKIDLASKHLIFLIIAIKVIDSYKLQACRLVHLICGLIDLIELKKKRLRNVAIKNFALLVAIF